MVPYHDVQYLKHNTGLARRQSRTELTPLGIRISYTCTYYTVAK